MLKKTTFLVYAIVILVMAMATFFEKTYGSSYVQGAIYGSWWFCALWALLAVGGIAYIVQRKVRKVGVILLHLSFVVILLGALLTHLSAWQGYVHLRKGHAMSACIVEDEDGKMTHDLPFTLRLDSFRIQYHNGTEAAADYVSYFTVTAQEEEHQGMVSMNHIYTSHGIRLYQSGYDEDGEGTTLAVNCDHWGIPVTYVGYGLLFLSMLLVLIDPKGHFQTLIRKASVAAVILLIPVNADALTTFSEHQAEEVGKLCINYGDRICPVQTLAIDFTRKLYGKSSYKSYTAEQVLCGFIFHRDEWNREPILRIKSGEVRRRFHLPEYTSVASLFGENGYLFGTFIEEYYQGNGDKLHEEVMKVDERVMLVMQVSRGEMLRIFPFEGRWYAPTDSMPSSMEEDRRKYFQCALPLLGSLVQQHKTAEADEMLLKMTKYQQTFGASELPSPLRLKAERIYNNIPFATILFMLCLTFALLSLFQWRWMRRLSLAVLIFATVALTFCLALRWVVSGYVPMTNGYETMLLMAWVVMLASLAVYRKFHIILTFGLMLSGFLLLVSHLGQMDPKITHLMPVLSSPLLSVHVSCVMMAYGLFSITFACGVYALIVKKKQEEMHLLSQLFLYPALFLLTAGIFIGAIWANVSWGRYWGWDPKEVWALITMLIYAFPMHSASFSWFRQPQHYHFFMVLAFLAVLITYFGVNFFLGGMHSYA